VKRQVHLATVEEVAIRVRVQTLKGGRYLGTSPDVPGLVAEGRSVSETIERLLNPAVSTETRFPLHSAMDMFPPANSAFPS
jgi:hypothetical protein